MYASDDLSQQRALMLCFGCPVRPQCLAEARATEPTWLRFGVRGGLTAGQRRDGWDRLG